MFSHSRMSAGREFQVDGAATMAFTLAAESLALASVIVRPTEEKSLSDCAFINQTQPTKTGKFSIQPNPIQPMDGSNSSPCLDSSWPSQRSQHAMKPDIWPGSRFLPTPPAFDAAVRRFRRNIATTFGTAKLEWCGYPKVRKFPRHVYSF